MVFRREKMFKFSTIEEVLEDLRQGKMVLVTDVQQSLQQLKILTLWQHMVRV